MKGKQTFQSNLPRCPELLVILVIRGVPTRRTSRILDDQLPSHRAHIHPRNPAIRHSILGNRYFKKQKSSLAVANAVEPQTSWLRHVWSLRSSFQALLEISCAALCLLIHFSHVRLFLMQWTIACQALLSIGFSKQEYWSGLSCPPSGNLPNPGIEPTSLKSPALTDRFFITIATWAALDCYLASLCLCSLMHIYLMALL